MPPEAGDLNAIVRVTLFKTPCILLAMVHSEHGCWWIPSNVASVSAPTCKGEVLHLGLVLDIEDESVPPMRT